MPLATEQGQNSLKVQVAGCRECGNPESYTLNLKPYTYTLNPKP